MDFSFDFASVYQSWTLFSYFMIAFSVPHFLILPKWNRSYWFPMNFMIDDIYQIIAKHLFCFCFKYISFYFLLIAIRIVESHSFNPFSNITHTHQYHGVSDIYIDVSNVPKTTEIHTVRIFWIGRPKRKVFELTIHNLLENRGIGLDFWRIFRLS